MRMSDLCSLLCTPTHSHTLPQIQMLEKCTQCKLWVTKIVVSLRLIVDHSTSTLPASLGIVLWANSSPFFYAFLCFSCYFSCFLMPFEQWRYARGWPRSYMCVASGFLWWKIQQFWIIVDFEAQIELCEVTAITPTALPHTPTEPFQILEMRQVQKCSFIWET